MNEHSGSRISVFPPTGAAPPCILIVDEAGSSRDSTRIALEDDGYVVFEAESLTEAVDALAGHGIAVLVMSAGAMAEGAAFDFVSDVRRLAPDVAIVVVQGSRDNESMRRCLVAGAAAYVASPTRASDVRAQVYATLVQRHRRGRERAEWSAAAADATRQVHCKLTARLAVASRLRDAETGAHVERIGRYSATLARALGFADADAELVGVAATAHDVGKIGIPDAILLKPGKLTADEFRQMQRHTVIGAAILGGTDAPVLQLAQTIALSHHERWDGSGYPNGLLAGACAIEARIVGVVDVYDALVHARVYKPAWDEQRVVELFREQRGKQFDPRIVDVFLENLPAMRKIRAELPEEATPAADGSAPESVPRLAS